MIAHLFNDKSSKSCPTYVVMTKYKTDPLDYFDDKQKLSYILVAQCNITNVFTHHLVKVDNQNTGE